MEARSIGNNANIDTLRFADTAVFDPARLASPNLGLCLEPSFRIQRTDRIFVIGSCFAREIRAAMTDQGFDATDGGLGNQYNTFGILQTVTWALSGGFDDRLIVRLDDGTWFNGYGYPFTHHAGRRIAFDTHQAILANVAAAIRAADVIVMTLGLVEVWHDDQLNTWLNGTPPKDMIHDFDRRFSVHRTTHAQNLDALLRVLDLLHSVNADLRIVCTVSPVPLHATFFGSDVIISNAYSKATLRSVATEAVETAARNGGPAIDYFPSYELATVNERNLVWRDRHPTGEPDGRHVRADFVRDVILNLFVKHYLTHPAPVA